MLAEQPLVSIIIPTYNRAHLIEETLNSVSSQTYTNWECIVVDDGSSDETEDLFNDYLVNDTRFLFVKRPNNRIKGASTCRNIGFDHAKGTYIMFFDSDDIMPHDVLNKRVQFALNNTGHDFFVFQTIRFYDSIDNRDCIWNDLSKSKTNDLIDFLNLSPVWSTLGPLWDNSFLSDLKPIYTEGVSSWQDWEFHIRVLLKTTNYLKNESESLAVFQRFHKGESINKNNSVEVSKNRISLVFRIIKILKTQSFFEKKEFQKVLFKLFYFIISKIPIEEQERNEWCKIKKTLNLIPKLDLLFWRYLMSFKMRKNKIVYLSLFRVFTILKIIYFNKRFSVEDYSDRTWYTLRIRNYKI